MSTIISFDEARSFYPRSKREPGQSLPRRALKRELGQSLPRHALALARIVWRALGEGMDASHRYNQLTARGLPPGEAADKLFDEFYRTR